MNKHDDNIFTYFGYCLMHAIPGLILGISIEYFTEYLQKHYKLKPLVAFIVQLILSILVLFVIETYISIEYAQQWQNITPGLIFIAFYFSTQPSLYSNTEKIAASLGLDKTKIK